MRPEMDIERTLDTYFYNKTILEQSFLVLSTELTAKLDAMRSLRPGIMEQAFDVVYDERRLKVVDTSMTEADKAWVEEQLNETNRFAWLAHEFNRAVVTTYDEESGAWDTDGVFHGHGAFYDGMDTKIRYTDLDKTVNSSVKLLSLLDDVNKVDMPRYRDENSRYMEGARLVQSYIQGEITTYDRQPGRVVEVHTKRGSILRDGIWL